MSEQLDSYSIDENIDLERLAKVDFRISNNNNNNKNKNNNDDYDDDDDDDDDILQNEIKDLNRIKDSNIALNSIMNEFHNILAEVEIEDEIRDEVIPISTSPPSKILLDHLSPSLDHTSSSPLIMSITTTTTTNNNNNTMSFMTESSYNNNNIGLSLKSDECNGSRSSSLTDDYDNNGGVENDSLTNINFSNTNRNHHDIELMKREEEVKLLLGIYDNNDNKEAWEIKTCKLNSENEIKKLIGDVNDCEDYKEAWEIKTSKVQNENKIKEENQKQREFVERLKNNCDSLKESLNNEKYRREKYEESLSFLQDELLEIKTQNDIDKESYKIEILKLKSQIRLLSNSNGLSEIYDNFEENFERIFTENVLLRKKLLEYELKETDELIRNYSLINHKLSNREVDLRYADKTIDRACISKEDQLIWNNNQNNLKILTKLKKISLEKNEIKILYEQLKKKERHFHMTNNSAQDVFRRLKIFHHDSIRMNEEIDNLKLIKINNEAKINIYINEIETQEKLNKNLINENTLLLNENNKLKNKFIEVEEDIKKVRKLDKYIKKHSTLSSNNNNENLYKNIKNFKENNDIVEDSITINKSNNNGLDPQLFSLKYFPKESHKNKKDGIEKTLFVLHEKLMKSNPEMLPIFNKLVDDIKNERETIISSSSYRQPAISSTPIPSVRSMSPKYSNNKVISFQTNIGYGSNIRKSM